MLLTYGLHMAVDMAYSLYEQYLHESVTKGEFWRCTEAHIAEIFKMRMNR